jgi:hypothetical protein
MHTASPSPHLIHTGIKRYTTLQGASYFLPHPPLIEVPDVLVVEVDEPAVGSGVVEPVEFATVEFPEPELPTMKVVPFAVR